MFVSKSTDNGLTWDGYELSSNYGDVYSILVDPYDSNIIYAGGSYVNDQYYSIPGLFKTTNGGTDWQEIGSTITGTIYALAFDPFNNEKIYLGSSGGFYTSNDGGSSCIKSPTVNSVRAVIADPITPNKIFAGTAYGVYVSTDGGTHWDTMNNGLLFNDIRCLDYDPTNNVLYAGTGGYGVFRCSPGTRVEDEDHSTILPIAAVLYQNYPNPFNMSTEIKYELHRSGRVNLSVFDINGRLIRNLVNTHQPAAIQHVLWDGKDTYGKDVSSGLYIYKLHTSNLVKMKKMVLQK